MSSAVRSLTKAAASFDDLELNMADRSYLFDIGGDVPPPVDPAAIAHAAGTVKDWWQNQPSWLDRARAQSRRDDETLANGGGLADLIRNADLDLYSGFVFAGSIGGEGGNVVRFVPRQVMPRVDELSLRKGGSPIFPFAAPPVRSWSPKQWVAFEEGRKRYLANLPSPEEQAATRAALEEKLWDWRREQTAQTAMTVGAGGAGLLYRLWPHTHLDAREPDPAAATQMRSYLQNVFPP